MLNLTSLKLRDRILWGYSVPLLLTIASTAAVVVNAQKVAQLTEAKNQGSVIVHESDRLDTEIQERQANVRAYLLTRDNNFANQYNEGVKNYQEIVDSLQKVVVFSKPEQATRLERIKELSKEITAINFQLIALVRAGRTDEAVQQFSQGKLLPLIEDVNQVLENFNQTEDELQKERQTETESAIRTLNLIAMSGAFGAAVLAIILGFVIASKISEKINENISIIVSASSEIAATTEQHERSAKDQASSVNQTSTTMDELNASARQAAEQAEGATAGARAIAEQVARMSEQTKQISSITGVVSDLANQTNMLALNAAVEAARAGEQGKGFAVVAGEIRKLADESKKSAERINGLIAEVQALTDSTVLDTSDGTRVESIVAAVNNIVLNNQRISLTAKQQAVAIEQVVAAINFINEGAVQTASGISQTKVGVHRLNQAAQDLKAVV